MKKTNLFLSALTLVGLLSFAGCGENTNSTNNPASTNSNVATSETSSQTSESTTQITSSAAPVAEKHTVTLVLNNGEGTKTRTVAHNKFMAEPIYEKEYFKCVGWYTDETLELEKWNFAVDRVTEDVTLYAKWEVDYENWVWRLGRIASKSTIMIAADHYRKCENGVYSGLFSAGFGSGVIIAKEEDIDGKMYYYALTNNHVVSNSTTKIENGETIDVMNFTTVPKITIYDHYINPYSAQLILSMNRYDLALVRFSTRSDDYNYSPSGGMIDPDYIDAANKAGAEEDYNNYKIRIAKFAEDDPEIGENVSSYGAPIAQPGVCTIGTVFDYRGGCIYDHEYSSSWIHEFDVIYHSASILSGNSGGPLYDVNLDIAGINYGSSGLNDTFTNGGVFWAIPISKVREFLDLYVVADTTINTEGQYTFLGDF